MSTQSPLLQRTTDRQFFIFNGVLSAVALSFLTYILVLRPVDPHAGQDLRFLPAVNAALNATSAVLLVAGYLAIRRKNRRLHQYLMVGAFTVSALFLVCYLVYHSVHGDTKFQGQGAIRPVYFFILISHILLSIGVVPMVLSSLWFAWRQRFETHRKIAKWTFPVWLYVSVTGVAIFGMLKSFNG